MRMVDKIKENMMGFKELYEQGVLGYRFNINKKDEVHLQDYLFINLVDRLQILQKFTIYESGGDTYPYKVSFQYNNIEYFMIFDESEYDEMVELVSEWNDDIS